MATINNVYGIDLGTCNSAVAAMDDLGRAETVPNDVNEPTTPSVVYFESPDNVIVGVEAKNMAEIAPERVVQFIKRFMGRKEEFVFEFNGKEYAPEEISALILKRLVAAAQRNLRQPITDVVITVPAYFDEAQRTATKNSGGLAGLNVLDIVNEPIAAAIAYCARTRDTAGRILVYDLGGGTFDVTVIEVSDRGWQILVTGGRHLLGGKEWDDRLISYIAEEFKREHQVNPLEDPYAHQELRTKAESMKKRLSAKTKEPVAVAFDGKKLRLEIDRDTFERITADLLEETITATRQTLDELETKTGDRRIDRFFLVGGSSRMPMVKARVDAEFGVDSEIYDPDECVAKGAAIWAVKRKMDALAAQEGGDRTVAREISRMRNRDVFLKLRGKSIRNVSSHTYGILAWDDGFEVVAPLLLKNQEIPHKHVSGENGSSRFGTAEDNQASIEVVLLETDGDSLDPMYCKEIGRGTVEMPPGIPADSEVVVTFNYAADGTMTLHAREVTSNSNCEVRTTRAGVMDEVEVELAETHLAVLSTS